MLKRHLSYFFLFMCHGVQHAFFAGAQVVINEIAWMGTNDSASNEWAELANTGSSIDLTGWILRIEGKKILRSLEALQGMATISLSVPTITRFRMCLPILSIRSADFSTQVLYSYFLMETEMKKIGLMEVMDGKSAGRSERK